MGAGLAADPADVAAVAHGEQYATGEGKGESEEVIEWRNWKHHRTPEIEEHQCQKWR